MSDENKTEATIDQPAGPQLLGEMLPEELQRLTGLKQQADQVVHQIGVVDVQRMRLHAQLGRLEMATNQIIQAAGKRLGIPDGTAWSVTQDGKAVQVGAPPVMRPTLVPTPLEGEASGG